MRAGLGVVVAALLLCAACGGSTPSSDDSPTKDAASCSGGAISFLQGQPTDLPGGGSAGIGHVFKTDPPTVGLAIGGNDAQAASHLAVGDTFTVQGTTYQITCISPSKVTAQKA